MAAIDQFKKSAIKLYASLSPGLQRIAAEIWLNAEVPLTGWLSRRRVLDAHRVFWPTAEVADFAMTKMVGPAPDEVLVAVACSLISPGTERAQFLALPGVLKFGRAGGAFYPGYQGSGFVVGMGKQVKGFKPGDRVAGRVKHSSLAVVKARDLFAMPDGASLEEASFMELAITALQGIRKARIRAGESVLVVGQGLVGQLANRFSRIAGGAPIVATATSDAKAAAATANGGADRFVTVGQLSDQMPPGGYDVVIEATGNPHVLPSAMGYARAGGRVVLLGSSRGLTKLSIGQTVGPGGVTLIGAHISGTPGRDQSAGRWTYKQEGQYFLDLLALGKLALDDLITLRADPADTPQIYESIRLGDPNVLGVLFDWRDYLPDGHAA